MSKDLTQGPIEKTLFNLAWPMAIGVFAIMGFNLADTYFVGQLGPEQLAAMSYTFPVVTFIMSISLGMGIGLSSLVSRAMGAKQIEEARSIATNGILFALFCVSIITVLGLATMDPLFRALGAKGQILAYIEEYMSIWYWTVFVVVIPMVGNAAIRATGDTKLPALIMVFAGLLNLIFDPILIFGLGPFPRLELKGAAIATVISRFLALGASLYVLYYREKLLVNPFKCTHKIRQHWRAMSAIALPAAAGNAIIPVSIFLITAMISDYGDMAVAGFGVGSRIESVITVVAMGLAASLGPFVGQNAGALQFDRIQKAMKGAHRFSTLWFLFCSILITFFADDLATQFSDHPDVIRVSKTYLHIIVFTLPFEAVLLNINSALNALGNAKTALSLTLTRMLIVYVPLAALFGHVLDYRTQGVFIAAGIANIVSGLLAYYIFFKQYKRCV